MEGHRSISNSVLAFMYLFCGFFGGGLAVLNLTVLVWLSHQRVLIEAKGKHGISTSSASRLGGVAVLITLLSYLMLGTIFPGFSFAGLLPEQDFSLYYYGGLSLIFGLIGLVDDVRSISPKLRIVCLFIIAIGVFVFDPNLLPNKVLGQFFDKTDLYEILLTIACSFLLVGFINAGNIADGANGLFGFIALSLFTIGYLLTNEAAFMVVAISLAVFLVFNVFTGLIVLGDFGSYAISAFIVLSCFFTYELNTVSVWLFASVLSYPCFEIVRIILVRFFSGESLIRSDNRHTHNYVFWFLETHFETKLWANSATGLVIGGISGGVPLALLSFGLLEAHSIYWLMIFLLQSAGYICLKFVAENTRTKSGEVANNSF